MLQACHRYTQSLFCKTAESQAAVCEDLLQDVTQSRDQLLTCLNNFWNRACGRVFQAMVSVMAVKIQLSSPRGVFLSVCLPGMRSIRSRVKPSLHSKLLAQNHRSATCAAARF